MHKIHIQSANPASIPTLVGKAGLFIPSLSVPGTGLGCTIFIWTTILKTTLCFMLAIESKIIAPPLPPSFDFRRFFHKEGLLSTYPPAYWILNFSKFQALKFCIKFCILNRKGPNSWIAVNFYDFPPSLNPIPPTISGSPCHTHVTLE